MISVSYFYIVLLTLYAHIQLLSASEIFFPSTQLSKANEPCTVASDRSPGLCSRPSKCSSFDRLMKEHKSFVKIACSPASLNLVCCPQITRTNTIRQNVLDISEPSNSPKGCGSTVDLAFVNILGFYRANETAERLEKDGFIIFDHVVENVDRMTDFKYKNGSYTGSYGEDFRIYYAIGGVDANIVLARYMAIIGEKTNSENDWFCDGVLINWEWVLTAAHCFKRTPNIVRLGDYDLRNDSFSYVDDPQDYGIKRIVMYPEYNFPSTNHDLALIQLDRRTYVARPDINPICLPWGQKATQKHVGKQVTLTGWGATQFGKPITNVLQEVNITVFDSDVCDRGYRTLRDYKHRFPTGINSETHLCAGDHEGGKDACQGDSGGPIIYQDQGKYYLAGIVSAGHGCGLKEFPGIYAPINTPKYLSWIKKVAF